MRLTFLYSRLRKAVTTVREMERLVLKGIETYLPSWIGYPVSLVLSRNFRLASIAAKACGDTIQADVVMYESYNGRDFAGNPYALFLHLLERPEYSHLTHILVAPGMDHPKVKAFHSHPRVRIVRPNTRAYIRYAETCRFFINNASYKPYLVKRDGQIYVYTWHSTLLKKLAMDKDAPWEARNVNRALVTADYFISPNRYTTDILLKSHGAEGFVDGTVAEFGYPRNDLTINTDKTALKNKLGISAEEKIILFAPTWRGEQFARDTVRETLEWREQLNSGIPQGYRILVKFHTMVYRFLDRKALGFCVPLEIDTNEILAVTDILVTDYSGIFFDYMITGNPIVFFTPDRENYANTKNGFYLDLDTLPGPVCDRMEQVVEKIRNIEMVGRDYTKKYREFREKYLSADDGRASERTIDLVFGGDPLPADSTTVYKRESGKKRVLFYPGPMNPNGVTTSFIALLSQIDFNTWNAAVLLPDDSKNREFQKRLDSRAGIFYMSFPDGFSYPEYTAHARFVKKRLGTKGRMPAGAYNRSVKKVFGEVRFDIVVNFHGYQPGDAARLVFGVDAGKKVIFLHNDLERDRVIKQPQLGAVFSLYKYYDRLFCVSEDSLQDNIKGMAEYVKSTFGDDLRDKMDYARNLIEPAKIREKSLLPSEGLSVRLPRPEECSFVTIGRLSPEKNHLRLLEAFAIVKRVYPDTSLYIVGDGAQRSILNKKVSSPGLSDSVMIIPFMANPYPLLASCDCFVLSSDIEGQPITVLEALTLNKPVIATDIAGPRGLLEQGYGRLVGRDAAALAQAMIDFIAGGRKLSRKTFDAEAYVAEVKEEFERKVLGVGV